VSPDAICTDNYSTKWISVNVHFINRSDGTGNFNPNDDGNGNSNMNGYKRAETVINFANQKLAANQQMWRPSGNNTPAPPIRVRYLLKGVYFHNSDQWITAYWNIDALNATYGVNTATEMNYYYTRSMDNGSELGGNGIAQIGGNASISSEYLIYLLYPDYLEFPSRMMRHEIGHNFTLGHTWSGYDGCADTPEGHLVNGVLSQCDSWSSDPNSPCNNWANVSNNNMDYNIYSNATTPCQIGFIHDHLNGWGNQYVHSCNGCDPVNSFFDLSGCFKVPISNPSLPYQSYVAGQELFLNGEASVNENQYKIEICEVSGLGSSTCIGGYYNSTWLNGKVGKLDLKNIYNFSPNKFYRVELAVASTSCPGVSSMSKTFGMGSGLCPTIGGGPSPGMGMRITTHPNPANNVLAVKYKMEINGDVDILLFDGIGNLVKSVKQQKSLIGDNENTIETSQLREGMYFLVLKSGEKTEKKTIYINH
jgi:hypothetical protein